MKKLLLSLLGAAVGMSAYAGVNFPNDFRKEFEFDPATLNGWTIYAPAGIPTGEYGDVFEDYSPDNAVFLAARYNSETLCFVWSNSQYTNGQPSDTWVISPEFEVTLDKEVLAFTACVIGMDNAVQNNISVYISEGGTAKEDFKLLQNTTISGSVNGMYDFNTADKRLLLSNYKGKKVRLALVNEGNYLGIMGFANISLSSWYAAGYPASSTFDEILTGADGKETFNVSMQASTPVTTTRYNVEFKTSGGFTYSSTERRQLNLTTLANLNISIPDITLTQPMETYTFTLTPDYAGAVPFEITGKFISAERIYDQVSVLEEATGTWCQWCPYGAVALDYYSHKYPASGTGNKVIGIAIHDNDPMQISTAISDYYPMFMTTQVFPGLPFISFNRTVVDSPSPDPKFFGSLIEQQQAQKSFVFGKLDKVYLNPENSEDMVADFSVTATYGTSFRPMNVAVAVVEDNVQGRATGYTQSNALPGIGGENEASILKNFGEDWLPYFQIYLDNPDRVSFIDIQYNHVARAIYPGFLGVGVPEQEAGEIYSGKLSFSMPSNVMVEQNTKVVLLVTDSATGEIITADEMPYDNFTFESGVEKTVDASAFSWSINGNELRVESAVEGTATLYNIDGSLLATLDIRRGTNTFNLGLPNGIVLLNFNGKTVKVRV